MVIRRSRVIGICGICLLVTLVGVPSRAEAQQVVASSFDQLRMAVRLGETVKVTDTSGREVTGKIADLSSFSLTLLMGGSSRQIAESDVATIRRRHHADLATGARWGLGIGAGFGTLLGVAAGAGRFTPAIAAVYGAFGTGIGVGVSAMIVTEDVVYGRRQGISVSLGF